MGGRLARVCSTRSTPLTDDDLQETVYIREEPHTIYKAIIRQMAHYAGHAYQILLLAKHLKGAEWQTLSIPRGQSEEFNRRMLAKRAAAGLRRPRLLRWGLLGTAQHQPPPDSGDARGAAVRRWPPSPAATRARGEAYAREWQIPVAHGSYDSAAARSRRSTRSTSPLPNTLHVEWTLRALDAGKHVLCEKPLALTADDVDRVEAVARARQRVVAEAFMYRHEPLIGRVLELRRRRRHRPAADHHERLHASRESAPNDVRLERRRSAAAACGTSAATPSASRGSSPAPNRSRRSAGRR